MSRKWIRAVLLLAGAVLTLVLTAAVAPAKTPGGKLSKEEAALLAKALKALGDSSNPADWETWTSPPITIDRP